MVLAPDPAAAEQDPVLARARDLMSEAEYAEAQRIISRRLANSRLSSHAKVQLYWAQGLCLVSLDNAVAAKSSFLKLLALEPFFEPGNHTSPKILSAFQDAKSIFEKAGGYDEVYRPRLIPIDDQSTGQNVQVHFSIGNLSRLSDVHRTVLYLRQLGTSDYTSIDMVRDASTKGAYVATIPASLVTPKEDTFSVEYYVDALSITFHRLSGVGTAKLPLSFLVTSDTDAHKLQIHHAKAGRPLVWPYIAGVSAIIAGAAVLGAVLSIPEESSLRVVVRQ